MLQLGAAFGQRFAELVGRCNPKAFAAVVFVELELQLLLDWIPA